MDNKNIWILTWGKNSEREISLLSAQAVKAWLWELGISDIQMYDMPWDVALLIQHLEDGLLDFCRVMWHGSWFEDGQYVWLLDLYDVQYQCATRDVLWLTANKYWTKSVWRSFGLPVADDFLFLIWEYSVRELDQEIQDTIWYPCVWKELDQWSSVWVHILHDSDDLQRVRNTYDSLKKQILLESYIEWDEITISVLDIDGTATALPLVHIIPPAQWWFDYTNKYNWSTQEICPSDFAKSIQDICEEVAIQAYLAVWCTRYGRVDAILTDDGPVLLEINTIPWFTSQSLFPKSAKAVWLEFPQLLEILMK